MNNKRNFNGSAADYCLRMYDEAPGEPEPSDPDPQWKYVLLVLACAIPCALVVLAAFGSGEKP